MKIIIFLIVLFFCSHLDAGQNRREWLFKNGYNHLDIHDHRSYNDRYLGNGDSPFQGFKTPILRPLNPNRGFQFGYGKFDGQGFFNFGYVIDF